MLKTLISLMALVLVLGFASGASADSLVAWFPFDDNAANATVQEEVANKDATFYSGAPTTENTSLHHSADRVFGTGSLSFDGSNDNVITTPADENYFDVGTGSFTVTFWIKTEDTDMHPLFKWQSSTQHYYFYGNPFRISIAGGGSSAQATTAIGNVASGEWVHVACVRDREYIDPETEEVAPRLFLYVNGSVANSVADGTGNLDNTADLKIGTLMNGLMDDVGLYDYALTTSQVNFVKNNGVGTPIPEPGTMLLASLGVLVLFLRKRR